MVMYLKATYIDCNWQELKVWQKR